MRKLTIFIFVLIFFSGCFFDFSNDINSIDSANNIKAEIINYKRNSKISYNYIFNDISSGKIYQAHSNRYYFNSGDRVYITIRNGQILNMILISRKISPLQKQSFKSEKIIRKSLHKNNQISVPQSENISF